MKGIEIKSLIKKARLNQWEVAEQFGISDSWFNKRLRYEFNEDETQRLIQIIDNLKMK